MNEFMNQEVLGAFPDFFILDYTNVKSKCC